MAFGGATHAVQLEPQVASAVFAAHAAPHTWYPALHARPHVVPSQVALPLVGLVHAVHELPHDAVLEFDTQAPPHAWKPALHAKPHIVPSHVDVAFAGGTHGAHDALPHDAVLTLLTHAPAHAWKPALHAKPHAPLTHVAVEFAGGRHGEHDDPQVIALASETHAAPQRWNPARHTNPQLVPSHVADAFAGATHAVHEAPHESALVLLRQSAPHAWKPALHAMPHVEPTHVALPLVTNGHAVHVPQWVGSVARFASQPLAGLLSQSANPRLQVKPHVPEVQFGVAFGGVGHALPHMPHVATVSRCASHPLPALPSQLPKPTLQFNRLQAPLTHDAAAFANEHAVPHAPQLAIVTLVLVSQPLVMSASQLPKPGRQVLIAHVPAVQVAPAFANEH